MNYVPAAEGAPYNTGQIKLHTAEDFEGMRKAGRLAAETLDMLVPYVVPGVTSESLQFGYVATTAVQRK